jgi:hypothetical protein
MTWYRQDAFLHPDNADFDPTQSAPGKIGGVKPSPATMADPPKNAVRETRSTDESFEERKETANMDDAVSPVAMDMAPSDEQFSPGRQEDGEFEGEPGFYHPGDDRDHRAMNLFGPDEDEEAAEN